MLTGAIFLAIRMKVNEFDEPVRSSAEITFNFYTQVVDDAHRKAIYDLERLLFPNVPRFAEGQNSGGLVN